MQIQNANANRDIKVDREKQIKIEKQNFADNEKIITLKITLKTHHQKFDY